jgi:N-acetylmuramoyl-L-alanine amidase
MKSINLFSPNFDTKRRIKKSIKFIIIHYTGMQSTRESLIRLCDSRFKVSCHFLISRGGTIYNLVNEKYIAWHAGKSHWQKYKNLNKNSIGIELANKGHEFGYQNFSKKQLLSLVRICKTLMTKYKIKNKNIIGHSDIAPLRKIDPGEKFPWKLLSKKNIGVWHDYDETFLKKLRKIKIYKKKDKLNFFNNLNSIGYKLSQENKSWAKKTTKAFQSHFRKELVNGVIDEECLYIAKNLVKKYKNPLI